MKSVLLILGSCVIAGAWDIDMYENLALNKPANQSRVAIDIPFATASRANDGNRTNVEDMGRNSCIITGYSSYRRYKNAWWTVDLQFISRIHEVLITYRNWGIWGDYWGCSRGRLVGFSIFVSNTSDFKDGIKCFQQNGSKPDVNRTPYPCSAIGRFVTVYNNRTHDSFPYGYSNEAVLELCEVEIPGCRFQHFGQNCTNTCFCKDVTCDYKTGQCNGGCQLGYVGESCYKSCNPGYFGENCSSRCPHCGGNKTCSQSGVCLDGCEAGFYHGQSPGCSQRCGHCIGSQCNQDGSCPNGCSNGYHQSDCKAICPANCNNRICDQLSGMCSSCSIGYYGTSCNTECTQYCKEKKCDFISGQCIACEPGHYGYNCTNECFNCGGNKTCDNSGSCLSGCQTGYASDYSPGCSLKLDNCNQEMTSNLTLPLTLGVLSGVILVILGTVMNVVLYRRTRASREKGSEIYMQPVIGHSSEHVYNHIQPGIQNTHASKDEELVDGDNTDTAQNLEPEANVYENIVEEAGGIKTDPI